MKQLAINLLKNRAKAIISKFQPKIVAVTGSVGKTSAKSAIELVLSKKYQVRTAEKNYNNEFGVPFTILGVKNPGKSVFAWLSVFWRSYRIKSYPEILVLEYGVDKPGDIDYLCDIAQPHVGVVTAVSSVHAEFFDDIDALAAEKARLIENLPDDGTAIFNVDDIRVLKMQDQTIAKVKTFGLQSEEISAQNIEVSARKDDNFEPGEIFIVTQAEITKQGAVIGKLRLKNVIGYAPVMSCLAALSVAEVFEIDSQVAIDALNRSMTAAPGRLNPIAGIKGSLIIDDSYNAAPAAMQNGLKILSSMDPGEEYDRRIAALGSMAELGQYTQDEHRMIGLQVAEYADLFIAVGENMKTAVEAAKEAGMDRDHIEWFADSIEAGRHLDQNIQQGDIVYVKGSQSSRMERVVKDLMAEPLRAEELLVRQEAKWLEQ
ncbi:MAG: Mur ligase family protein [Patescibacteria group bacterium]